VDIQPASSGIRTHGPSVPTVQDCADTGLPFSTQIFYMYSHIDTATCLLSETHQHVQHTRKINNKNMLNIARWDPNNSEAHTGANRDAETVCSILKSCVREIFRTCTAGKLFKENSWKCVGTWP